MKNYLVIGGGSGIGASIVRLLSESGHSVYSTHRSNKGPELPGVAHFQYDTLDEQGSLAFLPDVLHGVAFCPGSIALKPYTRVSSADLLHDFRAQVEGLLNVMRICAPKLKSSGEGSLVAFSTVAVGVGMPFHVQVAAVKGAVESVVRSLAAELAPAIRVNCIAPSLTDTPLAASLLGTPEKREASAQRHPLKRIGHPDEIASTATFLLSPASSWITGQVIAVDGGMSAIR